MRRSAQSFIALFTAFSVACSGSMCGSSQSARNSTGSTDGPGAADASSAGQAAAAASTVETLVQEFGRALSGARPGEQLTPDQARARLQKLYGLLEATSRTLPRDTFDFSAVTSRVSRDPARLRDWVSTQTTLVPYRGVLRDATGTLMDRVGNSLDRALLLARLIREAGGQARLARAQLSTEQASALFEGLQRLAGSGIPTPSGVPEPGDAEVASFAQQAGLTPDVVRSHAERIGQATARIRNDVRARVKSQAAAIARAVGLVNDATGAGNSRAASVQALQDHWWVQVQNGGAWVDLDPAADGPARVLAPVQETTDPGQIAADLYHQVEIRVIVERWDGSQLTEASPVSLTARPSEIIGTAVELRQVPMAWPAAQAGGTTDAAQTFRNAVLAQREWLPMLVVGARRISRASITETGELNDRPGSRPNPIRSAAGGMFDALGGGGDDPPPGVLTGEWLEYVIHVPGSPARTIRREVFDLVGPAARAAREAPPQLTDEARLTRGLSLIGQTDILVVANHLSGAFVAHQTVSSLQAARPVFESIATGTTLSSQSLAEQMSNVPRLPNRLHELASARQDWASVPGLVYTAQPNIFSRHILPGGADGRLQLVEAIDIVANEVDVRPAADVSSRLARLEHGVLDANLEAALLAPTGNRSSTADSFGSGEHSDQWATVRTPQDLAPLALPADVRARIEAELQAGYVVVVARPGGEPTTSDGWWRIDPRTGDLLTIGDRGWGQTLTEKVMTTAIVATGTYGVCRAVADIEGRQRWDNMVCLLTGTGAGIGMVGLLFYGTVTVSAIVLGALAAFVGGAGAGAGQN